MKPSWLEVLEPKLKPSSASDHPPRLAIVGIGNELRGDDAAGLVFARTIKRLLTRCEPPVLVIDAGAAPENFTGRLRQFKPELVLFADAAQMNEIPGTVQLLDLNGTTGLDGSTHTLPPWVIAQYLVHELGCQVALLGIQPESDALGDSLSPRVRSDVAQAARDLAALVDPCGDG